jgi:hypothetical protein
MNEARVDILDLVTRRVVDHCYGPTLAGGCPSASAVGTVACHGRLIVPLGEEPDHWLLRIQPTARRCPLA